MTWQSTDTLPREAGCVVIGLGYVHSPEDRNGDQLDVRLIRCWKIGDSYGWSALNRGRGWTVGFWPVYWMPYEGPDEQ